MSLLKYLVTLATFSKMFDGVRQYYKDEILWGFENENNLNSIKGLFNTVVCTE